MSFPRCSPHPPQRLSSACLQAYENVDPTEVGPPYCAAPIPIARAPRGGLELHDVSGRRALQTVATISPDTIDVVDGHEPRRRVVRLVGGAVELVERAGGVELQIGPSVGIVRALAVARDVAGRAEHLNGPEAVMLHALALGLLAVADECASVRAELALVRADKWVAP